MDEKMKKLRKAQLKIAVEIKRICEKHNIRYFLDAGSMLGAVRHGGYIPWDDDIDFGMTDTEYRRFLKIAPQELGDDFFIDNYAVNKENALVFTKVRLKNTVYIERKGNEKARHNEIFVDIFPYYFVSDKPLQRKREAYEMLFLSQAILSRSGYKVWKGDGWIKRIKFIPSDIIGRILTKKHLHKMVDRLYCKHMNTENLCIHDGSSYRYWYFPRKVFDDYQDILFEGIVFKIPKQYDLFLTTAYGDYMQLPPEEKRVTHQITRLEVDDRYLD